MNPRVVLVTDPAFDDGTILRCIEVLGAALPAGTLSVQLRDKRRLRPSLRLFAIQLRRTTRAAGAALVINGDAGLAREVEADGVHLGGGAGSVSQARAAMGRSSWVSVAAHSDDDVRRAVAEGANAVLVSAIFPTRSASPQTTAKRFEKPPRGLAAVEAARAIAGRRLGVVALGGITAERARGCARAGADGVAVIRALLASPVPASVARRMYEAMTRCP